MSTIREWSTTAASNSEASPDGFPEGMAPSGVNNSAREVMAQTKTWAQDAEWLDWGHDPTYVSATSFTVETDLTAVYLPNRRVKLFGTTMGTFYGTISSSSYSSPNTTVNVILDSGALTSNLSLAYIAILSPGTNNSLPLKPSFHATLAATQTNITGTDKIDWDVEEFDNGGMFASGTWSPTVPGAYILTANLEWTSTSFTDDLFIYIYKDGAFYKGATMEADSGSQSLPITAIVTNNGSNTFDIYANNNARDTSGAAGGITIPHSYFSGSLLG